jgi:hypothetical protein
MAHVEIVAHHHGLDARVSLAGLHLAQHAPQGSVAGALYFVVQEITCAPSALAETDLDAFGVDDAGVARRACHQCVTDLDLVGVHHLPSLRPGGLRLGGSGAGRERRCHHAGDQPRDSCMHKQLPSHTLQRTLCEARHERRSNHQLAVGAHRRLAGRGGVLRRPGGGHQAAADPGVADHGRHRLHAGLPLREPARLQTFRASHSRRLFEQGSSRRRPRPFQALSDRGVGHRGAWAPSAAWPSRCRWAVPAPHSGWWWPGSSA